MSRWSEKLEQHPLHATIEWLNDSVSTEFEDAFEDEAVEKRRLKKLISMFKHALDQLDPELAPFSKLDSLNTSLRSSTLKSKIDSYANTGNVGSLAGASDLIANQVEVLLLLTAVTSPVSSEDQVQSLVNIFDATTNTLVARKNELSESLERLKESTEEKEERLVSVVETIDQKQREISNMLTELQKQFSSAQETRSQEFSKWRDNFSAEKNTDANNVIDRISEKLDGLYDDLKLRMNSILKDAEEKHKAILELYELTAGDSVGAGYMKTAEEEKNAADRWRQISLGFMAVAVIWVFVLYNSSQGTREHEFVIKTEVVSESESGEVKEDARSDVQLASPSSSGNTRFDWYRLLLSFSLSGILLWGSAYSAQQSTKHRESANRNRRLALEIMAIDPYISSLDVEAQKEIKEKFSEKIFSQSSVDRGKSPRVVDEHALGVVSDAVAKILDKLPK